MLEILNQYSTIILCGITAIYAYLTWRMVKEMRMVREAELEPHIIASLIPFGPLYVKLQIKNVGPGVAFDVNSTWKLEPLNNTEEQYWRQPVMPPETLAEFRLPNEQNLLTELASNHNKLVINLLWRNIYKKDYSDVVEIDLIGLRDAWTKTKWLVSPEPIETRLKRMEGELKRIATRLLNITLTDKSREG